MQAGQRASDAGLPTSYAELHEQNVASSHRVPGMSAGQWLLQYSTKKELRFWTESADEHGRKCKTTLVVVSHRKFGLMSIADDAQRSGNTACFCNRRERSWTGESPALGRRGTPHGRSARNANRRSTQAEDESAQGTLSGAVWRRITVFESRSPVSADRLA